MAVAEIFRALGDPVRLELVQRLSNGAPCTIKEVTSELNITRQGARKHLQVLADAKLITLEPKGRDVLVQLEPEVLDEARIFIANIERKWDQRLEALRNYLEQEP
jgi:DNA-binding transcriptional ArsR family regulator